MKKYNKWLNEESLALTDGSAKMSVSDAINMMAKSINLIISKKKDNPQQNNVDKNVEIQQNNVDKNVETPQNNVDKNVKVKVQPQQHQVKSQEINNQENKKGEQQ